MHAPTPQELARAFYHALNAGDLAALDLLLSSGFTDHGASGNDTVGEGVPRLVDFREHPLVVIMPPTPPFPA